MPAVRTFSARDWGPSGAGRYPPLQEAIEQLNLPSDLDPACAVFVVSFRIVRRDKWEAQRRVVTIDGE
jgi:hypothetical protein